MSTFSAGVYYIGDPCYVWPREGKLAGYDWSDLLDATDYLQDYTGTVGGHKIFCHGTMYGDGGYDCFRAEEHLGNIPVDAGLIAVMPAALVESSPRFNEPWLGQAYIRVEMHEDFNAIYEDGTFYIGDDIAVYTGEDPYQDEEELE
jgi:hypothetical protein